MNEFTFKLSDEQRTKLQALADKSGMTLQEYIVLALQLDCAVEVSTKLLRNMTRDERRKLAELGQSR